MKAAFVVAALLIVGSNALLLDSFQDTFQTVADHLTTIKETGKSLLSGLLAKGKEVLSGAVSSVLQAGASLAAKTGLLTGVGKRDMSNFADFLKGAAASFKDKLSEHGGALMSKFGQAMDKLKDIFMNMHQKLHSADDVSKAVDTVVDDAAVSMDKTKRFFISDVTDALSTVADVAKDVVSNPVVQTAALTGAKLALAAALTKRNVVTDFFAPHITTLTDALSTVGSTIKGHASNLFNSVKDSVASLGAKLGEHVNALKQHGSTLLDHGKNALDALKSAVGDVLSTTLANAKPALDGILSTGANAAGVVANHVADAVSGSTST